MPDQRKPPEVVEEMCLLQVESAWPESAVPLEDPIEQACTAARSSNDEHRRFVLIAAEIWRNLEMRRKLEKGLWLGGPITQITLSCPDHPRGTPANNGIRRNVLCHH